MGDIPNKLKEYEKNLRMLIKESGTKMEQVTSSICVATTSLGKRANEEIISSEGPSKRTRQRSRKKALKDVATSTANSIQDTTEIGKEATKMIMELQQKIWLLFLVLFLFWSYLLDVVNGSCFFVLFTSFRSKQYLRFQVLVKPRRFYWTMIVVSGPCKT